MDELIKLIKGESSENVHQKLSDTQTTPLTQKPTIPKISYPLLRPSDILPMSPKPSTPKDIPDTNQPKSSNEANPFPRRLDTLNQEAGGMNAAAREFSLDNVVNTKGYGISTRGNQKDVRDWPRQPYGGLANLNVLINEGGNRAVLSDGFARKDQFFTSKKAMSKRNKEQFDPIPITYTELLPQLLERRQVSLTPLEPLNHPFPDWYNPNARCEYHAGAVGHSIEYCSSFKKKSKL